MSKRKQELGNKIRGLLEQGLITYENLGVLDIPSASGEYWYHISVTLSTGKKVGLPMPPKNWIPDKEKECIIDDLSELVLERQIEEQDL